jgi:phytoene dehydrogenase-like protein
MHLVNGGRRRAGGAAAPPQQQQQQHVSAAALRLAGRAAAARRSARAASAKATTAYARPSSSTTASAAQAAPSSARSSSPPLTPHETDVVVIGSGVAGLSCAALLAKVYGLDVTVLEAHSRPGGCAHSFTRRGGRTGLLWDFEAGPSLYNGMASRGPGANPLALVLQAIGEGDLPLIRYDQWRVHLPEGTFDTGVGAAQFRELLLRLRGEEAAKQWDSLRAFMPPLAQAATSLPPLALRADWGVVRTALVRYAGRLLGVGGKSGGGSLPPVARLGALTQPFSRAVLDRVPVTDPFLRNWYDLLCFLLSGLDSGGTIAASIAFMDELWYGEGGGGVGGGGEGGGGGGGGAASPSSSLPPSLEFPVGGSNALVEALRRGMERGGGKLYLNARVDQVIVEDGKAVGVRVFSGGRGGSGGGGGGGEGDDDASASSSSSSSTPPAPHSRPIEIRARRAVVSSASVWDTLPLLPPGAVPEAWRRERQETPPCPSFMHLHLGFDAEGLAPFPMHHLSVRHWEGDGGQSGVTAEQNVVLVSIPSVEDATLRPRKRGKTEGGGENEGDDDSSSTSSNHYHALHAYTPATEPWFGLWDQVQPGTDAYERLKEERSRVLWEAAAKAAVLAGTEGEPTPAELAAAVDELKRRCDVVMVGTPHTHKKYLRRAFGSYGPAIRAGEAVFEFGGATPLPGFLMASDSVFPGIGLPAVAAAGAIAANTLVTVEEHEKKLLEGALGI